MTSPLRRDNHVEKKKLDVKWSMGEKDSQKFIRGQRNSPGGRGWMSGEKHLCLRGILGEQG